MTSRAPGLEAGDPTHVPRDLAPLFDPRSIAVVGASNEPATWGNVLAQGALRGERRRDVYLVNRNGADILGRPSWRSLGELPGPAELVVVAVPEAAFETTVDEALAAGARAIVGITAGMGELGAAGRAREQAGRGSGSRRRRGTAGPELPRRLRCGRRAGRRVERAPAGLDRAGFPER